MKVIKINKDLLKICAHGCYVDSPVYFDGSWFVRWLNWKKLSVLFNMGSPNGITLDLACGNGVALPTLSKVCDEVYAVDLHTEAARKLRDGLKLVNVNILETDAYDLPFPDKMFDTIIAASALEHFENIDGILSEIQRVLKPSGQFYFLVPSENWLYRLGRAVLGYTKPADHYHTAKEILKAIEKYFKPVKSKAWPLKLLPVYEMAVIRKLQFAEYDYRAMAINAWGNEFQKRIDDDMYNFLTQPR